MFVKAGTDTVGGMSDEDQFDPPARLTEEQLLSARIVSFREERGMSQSAVADAMKAAGHRWSQSTVYKVENSERKLTFVEGFALARILKVDPESLLEAREIAGEVIRITAQLQIIPLRVLQFRREISQYEEWLESNAGELYENEIADITTRIAKARESLGDSEA